MRWIVAILALIFIVKLFIGKIAPIFEDIKAALTL